MQTRMLGDKQLPVTPFGLGCWQLGADWGEAPDEETAFGILTAATDAGVRFFDTADVYGDGRSERLIGSFLQQTRLPVRVATKFGRAGGIYPNGYSRDALRRAVDASRERLQTSSLDLLQLHCIPTAVLRRGEVFDWLRDLEAGGSIRGFGVSVETIDEGLLCLEQAGLQSLQVILNVLRQRPLDELLPAAARRGVGVIARVPLASGVLSGKFSRATRFGESDHRHYNRDGAAFNVGETFGGLPFVQAVEFSRKLEADYLPEGLTMPQFALRWLLDQEAVTTVIPGASSARQAQSNAGVAALPPLLPKLHARLRDFYRQEVEEHIRGPY